MLCDKIYEQANHYIPCSYYITVLCIHNIHKSYSLECWRNPYTTSSFGFHHRPTIEIIMNFDPLTWGGIYLSQIIVLIEIHIVIFRDY